MDLVRKAVSQQGGPYLPHFPQGHFVVISNDPEVQVAFRDTAGCRSTDSKQHSELPLPMPTHKEAAVFTQEPKHLQVGFPFLYGHSHPYTVRNGEIVIGHHLPLATVPEDLEPSENQITVELVSQLKAHYGHHYNVMVGSGHDSNHYCPFSGGGDVHIFRTDPANAAAVLEVVPMELVSESGETTPISGSRETTLNVTPPKAGERRCGAVEGKGSCSLQSPSSVTMQLQADMVLLCATLLERVITSKPKDAESIGSLACYGIQLGLPIPLKLLKLTIDFDNQEMEFKELFSLPKCAHYGAYIDISLNYVFEALK